MHLTERTDLGLRVLLYLSVNGDVRTSVGTIAGAYGISEAHLAKVVQHLARAGFVETVSGRKGGVRLARPPEEVRVGDVVRALEPMNLVECFPRETNRCPVVGVCGLAPALAAAGDAFLAVLDGVTLADAARDRAGLALRFAQPAR